MKNKKNKSITHKFILITLIAILLCQCVGCNENNNHKKALSSASMPDFQYMFKILGAQAPTQKSDSGYYNLLDNKIVYTDKSTLKSTPLCNKSDCLHSEDYPDCNSKIKDRHICFDNFQIYKDNLYYFAFDTNSNKKNEQKSYLKSISLDGSEKSTVLTLNNVLVTDWFLYDGYFYYQSSVNIKNNKGNTMSGNFYRINLATNKEEIFADFSKTDGIYGAEGSLRNVYNGYMYLTLSGYKNKDDYNKIINGETIDGDVDTVVEIYRYNLDTGSYAIINPYKNEYEFIGFLGDKLLGYEGDSDSKNFNICLSEIDGTNPKKIMNFEIGSQVYCDNKYIYVINYSIYSDSTDDTKKIEVYDESGSMVSRKIITDDIAEDILITTFYDDYIWFQKSNASDQSSLFCIKKADLLKEGDKLEYKEVY